ncbi:uncharacterized protein METZ01_LOCUS445830, partial [marine metagenome]
WPDAGRARLESSPSTQIIGKPVSSNCRAVRFSWETESISSLETMPMCAGYPADYVRLVYSDFYEA